LSHTGKYRTEDKLKTPTINKLNTTQKKQTTQNTAKQKYRYPGLVASHDTWPGNEVGLFYNAPEPTAPRRAVVVLTLRRPLLPYGYSCKASCARPG